MNVITLAKKELSPYETLEGSVSWQLDKEPKGLELRLFWFTRGRGDEEAEIVQVQQIGSEQGGQRSFSFILPGSPWSVDGSLVSIVWGVELVDAKGTGLVLEEFIMGPGGRSTRLQVVTDSKSEGKFANKLRRLGRNPR